ncbi:MAG TPA: GNAT family N-acetyltransferase, partial [Pirellulaceae bacterium]|nr:GNAT family N-acetyltransferase [Pirellulaceae bacterium]
MLAQPLADGRIQLPKTQPALKTERLVLRPFTLADAPLVQILAGDKDVASTTRLIPHPYPDGLAVSWISTLPSKYQQGDGVNFAITLKEGALIGSIGLILSLADHHGELGYWIGKPYWNSGYCTEAAAAMLQFAFDTLDLERVFAKYMGRNPASGRVLAKLGMTQEGILRHHRCKWGQFDDLVVCGILRSEWQTLTKARAKRRT